MFGAGPGLPRGVSRFVEEDRSFSFFDSAFVYMSGIASLLLMTIAIKR